MQPPLNLLFFAVSLFFSGLPLHAEEPPAAPAPEVRIQALFEDKAMLEINGETRLVKAGETTPEGITLVRADSVDAVLAFNGEEQSYTVDTQIRLAAPGSNQAPVRITANLHGMYLTTGFINDNPVKFIVDTGATMVSLGTNLAKSLDINYKRGKPALISTANGVSKAYLIDLYSVRVGNIEEFNVSAVVTPGMNHDDVVLLGMSFMGRLQSNNSGSVLELIQKR